MKNLVLILSVAILCSANTTHDEDDYGNEVKEFWLTENTNNVLKFELHCDEDYTPEIKIRSKTESGIVVDKYGFNQNEEICLFEVVCDVLCTNYFFSLPEDEVDISVLVVDSGRQHFYRFYLEIELTK